MVFEASLSAMEPFLIDCLYPCLCFCESLFGMLLGFCLDNIVFIFDFKKAFFQILLHKYDKDFVQFLWFGDVKNLHVTTNTEIVQFRMYRLCQVFYLFRLAHFFKRNFDTTC